MFQVKRAAAVLVLAVTAVYAGDYLSARLRGSSALGTVEVQPYYAVPLRDGKTEFMMLEPEERTCVYSLFPHFGYGPCWYVKGKREQRIDM